MAGDLGSSRRWRRRPVMLVAGWTGQEPPGTAKMTSCTNARQCGTGPWGCPLCWRCSVRSCCRWSAHRRSWAPPSPWTRSTPVRNPPRSRPRRLRFPPRQRRSLPRTRLSRRPRQLRPLLPLAGPQPHRRPRGGPRLPPGLRNPRPPHPWLRLRRPRPSNPRRPMIVEMTGTDAATIIDIDTGTGIGTGAMTGTATGTTGMTGAGTTRTMTDRDRSSCCGRRGSGADHRVDLGRRRHGSARGHAANVRADAAPSR